MGIDYCGYSVISCKELCKAKIIFGSWKNIIEKADSEIILTGEYCWTEEETEGQYEKLLTK